MAAEQGAMQQFQDMRSRFRQSDYTAVQHSEMFNLVLQLEAALKTVDESVCKTGAAVAFGCPEALGRATGFNFGVAKLYEAGPAYFYVDAGNAQQSSTF